MKKLLILAALAGFGVMACGDDGDDKENNGNGGKADAGGGKSDAGIPVRPIQVTNVGAACTSKAECQGPAGLCETELGMDDMTVELPGGYCTAQCNATAECGNGGGCPVAEITATLPPAALELAAQFGLNISDLLPSNCYQKCTVGAASGCRTGYECKSISELVPANLSGNQLAAGFLGSAPFKVTYCLPPIELGDAGVPDAGAALVVGGIDAGL